MFCEKRITVPAVLLAAIAVFAVLDQDGVKAQVQPPEGSTLQDHWCWKQRVCRGAAEEGQCSPVGNLCKATTCGRGELHDGCEWQYMWACYPSCEETCTHIEPEEWGWDCGASCTWLSYNDCECMCADLGINTFEAGFYSQCE